MKRFFYFLLLTIVLVGFGLSCSNNEVPDKPIPGIEPPPPPDPPTGDPTIEGDVEINFDVLTVTVKNPYENEGITITPDKAHVVVRSTVSDTVTYVIAGATPNGSLKIYSETPFILMMNGIGITNLNDPALNIQTKKKATITLVDGSTNYFVGGKEFISDGGDEKAKAAFFSRGQLVFTGTGGLAIYSYNRHAICSDDYIRVNGGHITIPYSENDGLHAKDYIEINDGTIDIKSLGDGMDSEGHLILNGGAITINTYGDKAHGIKSATETTVQSSGTIDIHVQRDAAKGFKSGGDMFISQGDISIKASGEACYDEEEKDISSASGIKCNGNLVIDGGQMVILSSGLGGKGINVNGALTINDGHLEITSTGDAYKNAAYNTKAKALKIDGDLTVNGGLIYAESHSDHAISAKGNLTIDGGAVIGVGKSASKKGLDGSSQFRITGGTLVGVGGAISSPTVNACTQYVVNYSGKLTQNTLFHVASSVGMKILTYQMPYPFSKGYLLFSSPVLVQNTNYTISSGGAVTNGSSFGGLYNDATYTGGTAIATFRTSPSSMVININ